MLLRSKLIAEHHITLDPYHGLMVAKGRDNQCSVINDCLILTTHLYVLLFKSEGITYGF